MSGGSAHLAAGGIARAHGRTSAGGGDVSAGAGLDGASTPISIIGSPSRMEQRSADEASIPADGLDPRRLSEQALLAADAALCTPQQSMPNSGGIAHSRSRHSGTGSFDSTAQLPYVGNSSPSKEFAAGAGPRTRNGGALAHSALALARKGGKSASTSLDPTSTSGAAVSRMNGSTSSTSYRKNTVSRGPEPAPWRSESPLNAPFPASTSLPGSRTSSARGGVASTRRTGWGRR